MVSSVGYGTASVPSTYQASVSGEASAGNAQSATDSAIGAARQDVKQDNAAKPAQPGVTVSISPEGAAASADVASSTSADASGATVSPVKAFAYGALGLERPDQPQNERNGFYTAGKWLAAGITIGGLISLLA